MRVATYCVFLWTYIIIYCFDDLKITFVDFKHLYPAPQHSVCKFTETYSPLPTDPAAGGRLARQIWADCEAEPGHHHREQANHLCAAQVRRPPTGALLRSRPPCCPAPGLPSFGSVDSGSCPAYSSVSKNFFHNLINWIITTRSGRARVTI